MRQSFEELRAQAVIVEPVSAQETRVGRAIGGSPAGIGSEQVLNENEIVGEAVVRVEIQL